METFTMSRKELPRAGLVKAALAGRITNRQAATALQLTVRQVQRLKRRFEAGGAPALRHGSRGQPSPRRLPAKLCAAITELMTTTYAGFNDVHLTEKLREVHGLEVCGNRCDAFGWASGGQRSAPAKPRATAAGASAKAPVAR